MATNDELKNILLGIKSDIDNSKIKLDIVVSDIASVKLTNEEIVKKLSECEAECQHLKSVNTELKDKLERAERAIESSQRNERSRNIVIFGAGELEQEDLLSEIIKIFTAAELDIKEDVQFVKRLGFNEEKQRPILISFNNIRLKSLVFRNIAKFKSQNLIIANDLSKEQRHERNETRKKLFDYKQSLERMGKAAIVKNTSLLCDGVLYNVTAAGEYIQVLSKQVNRENDGEDEFDSTDLNNSIALTPSRKRGRSTGSKNSVIKKTKKEVILQNTGTLTNFVKRGNAVNNPE